MRSAPPPDELVAASDRLVRYDDASAEQLLDLILSHDTVVVW